MKVYTCKHCQKEFTDRYQLTGHVTKEHAKTNGSKIKKEKNIEEYDKSPNRCKHCNSPLSYKERHKIFCDNSCAASYNNVRREKKPLNYCRNCGKEIKRGSKFCCNICQHDFHAKERVDKWLTTGELLISSSGQIGRKQYVRDYIIKEQEGKCGICGIREVWNAKPLTFILDHISGDSTDNTRKNLRLVCSNCDSQLDTYKAKNRGNGRRSKGFKANF